MCSLNNNRLVIDRTSNVDYTTTEYNKWKSSIDNNQKHIIITMVID